MWNRILSLFRSKETMIEVSDNNFNPVVELMESYKRTILLKDELIQSQKEEISTLRNQVVVLNAKLSNIPVNTKEVPQIKHFHTTAALQNEMEARSKAEAKRIKDEAEKNKSKSTTH